MSDKDKVIAGSASFRKHPMPASALSIRLPPVRRWCDEVFRRARRLPQRDRTVRGR